MQKWLATPGQPVKVINFLLNGYLSPPLGLTALKSEGVFDAHPPQSITRLDRRKLETVLAHVDLGFQT